MIQSRHLIDEETKVGEARREAAQLAHAKGLGESGAGTVAIAATELATNLLRHGGGGELLIQPIRHSSGALIELLAIDRGRGMNDVQRCLADGYSTAGSAGTGLGAVRRMAAEFDIYSIAGEGTVVLARIGAKPEVSSRSAARFGAINIPVAGESVCGDSWRLAIDGGASAMVVADGLGHGALAADAARSVTGAFDQAPFEAPGNVLKRAHRAAAGTRGAAAACARIGCDGAIVYAGVGNISGFLVGAERSQGMVSHGGTLGLTATRMQEFDYRRSSPSLVVMHSDGLSARWDLQSRRGLMQCHPAIVAAILYRDHARGRDDSTVVVLS